MFSFPSIPIFVVQKGVSAAMVRITFPDRETEKRATGFLIGRFSGRILKSGEHVIPEQAVEALADQGIAFTVKGKAVDEPNAAEPTARRPRFGSARGLIEIADDFDAPLEDFADYM